MKLTAKAKIVHAFLMLGVLTGCAANDPPSMTGLKPCP